MNNPIIILPEKLKLSQSLMVQEIEGESVLLDMTTEKYFGLNETGTMFITAIKNGNSVSDAVSHISQEYDVNRETLETDLIELINTLVEKGLVQTT